MIFGDLSTNQTHQWPNEESRKSKVLIVSVRCQRNPCIVKICFGSCLIIRNIFAALSFPQLRMTKQKAKRMEGIIKIYQGKFICSQYSDSDGSEMADRGH